jgi:hypothetical protein
MKELGVLNAQLHGEPSDPELWNREYEAFAARMNSLYEDLDDNMYKLVHKRAAYRAAHGPGSSWAAGSIRGFISAEHARLLDAVDQTLGQLQQENEHLQLALLLSAGEDVWLQLPVRVTAVLCCS